MNQHEPPRRVTDLATAFGVDANTIRQWCKRYAAYLSDGAKPPVGGTRLFSSRDFAVLSYVNSALNAGMIHGEIAMNMGEMSFNDGESDIIVGIAEVLAPESPSIHPESPTPHEGIQLVLNELVSLRQELATERAKQGTRMDYFMSGAVVGIFCAIIVAALWFYLWGA